MTGEPAAARRGLIVAALAVICALLATGCSTGDDAVVQGQGNQIVAPDGKTTIHYAAADRQRIGSVRGDKLIGDGEVNLDDLAGQVVVINVWASWCPPCRKEFAVLETVYEETRDKGVSFVGIDFRDNRSNAEDFVTDRNVPYPSIYDYGGRTMAVLGVPVSAVPTTIILDRQLRPAVVFLRAVTEDELRDAVLQVVGEDAGTQ
ncbi:TlpA family protein disulfide reductase [Gordonia sp. VNK21]|uniref:TlpA family protein disulfide reductase n=1 Tax=Gordonia sp. VNK21 TaxID=3382483 RepID=UPI0038D4939B